MVSAQWNRSRIAVPNADPALNVKICARKPGGAPEFVSIARLSPFPVGTPARTTKCANQVNLDVEILIQIIDITRYKLIACQLLT